MSDPVISYERSTFSLMCGVTIAIAARPERIWTLLTDGPDFPRWNSTVASVEGRIAEGQTLRLRVPGTERAFTPKVSGVVPNERMTWTGGFAPMFKGVRTFALTRLDRIDVRVPRSRGRAALRGAGLGLVGGLVAGSVVGAFGASRCARHVDDMCGLGWAVGGPVVGMTFGLPLGAIIGAGSPGRRWQRVR